MKTTIACACLIFLAVGIVFGLNVRKPVGELSAIRAELHSLRGQLVCCPKCKCSEELPAPPVIIAGPEAFPCTVCRDGCGCSPECVCDGPASVVEPTPAKCCAPPLLDGHKPTDAECKPEAKSRLPRGRK